MKIVTFIILVAFLFACSSKKGVKRVEFYHIKSSLDKQEKKKYKLQIPDGFRQEINKAGAEVGTEHKYTYADNSIIYISDFGVSPNAKNLEKGGYPSNSLNKKGAQLINQNDTLIYEGQDKNDLFWKEIIIGNLEVGYLNTPKSKKKLYDQALSSLDD